MFENTEALRFDRHQHLRYRPVTGFRFAAELQSVPLTYTELIEAAKHYPIVFPAPHQGDVPIALLSLSPKRNDFVDAEGHWTAAYVPAHVRRYPFILGRMNEENGQFAVMVDVEAPHFQDADNGEALFAGDNEPGRMLRQIIDFLTTFQKEVELTRVLVNALSDAGLLAEHQMTSRAGGEQRALLSGFFAVERKRFDELPDETVLDWRRRGILPMVYAHLASLSNVQRLLHARSDRSHHVTH